MRVIVTGGRNGYAADLAEEVINQLVVKYGLGLVVVYGAATGIGRSFAEACPELRAKQEPTRPIGATWTSRSQ
jgi:hypothetical protein